MTQKEYKANLFSLLDSAKKEIARIELEMQGYPYESEERQALRERKTFFRSLFTREFAKLQIEIMSNLPVGRLA